MDFWILAFQAAAIAFVVTRSGLFAPLRDHGPEAWRSFIRCSLCVGVWSGMILTAAQLWAAGYRPASSAAIVSSAAAVLGTGALSGAVALGFVVAIDFLDGVATAATKLATRAVVMAPAPRISFPDESPTQPDPYTNVTKKVSQDVIDEAQARIAERKNE